jgi:hypothetical protein
LKGFSVLGFGTSMDLQIIEKSKRECATFEGGICLPWNKNLEVDHFSNTCIHHCLAPQFPKKLLINL